jgi:aryl sulfotransferase
MRYRSPDEDSARWDGFPFRQGDIVISTRSKSGTTWVQMICALLIFQTPQLPDRLSTLSPWLDWLIVPRDEVFARLAAQRHRRFIKTHTPLDGVPIDPQATYLVLARHPLDMAVSLFHQGANLNRERIAELTHAAAPAGTLVARRAHGSADDPDHVSPRRVPATAEPPDPVPAAAEPPDPVPAAAEPPDPGPAAEHTAVKDALLAWIDRDVAPAEAMDSLPGVMWHLADAWRRRHDDNVLLVHYADLSADLDGEMRRIARRLGIEVPDDRWTELVRAAGFAEMRSRAQHLAPDPAGILKDRDAFFRRGSSGAGRELLTDAEFAHYLCRVAGMGPPDLLAWLHR